MLMRASNFCVRSFSTPVFAGLGKQLGGLARQTYNLSDPFTNGSRYLPVRSLTQSAHLHQENQEEENAAHFKTSSVLHPLKQQFKMIMQDQPYHLPHPIWNQEELTSVEITHLPPPLLVDKAAYYSVQTLRLTFDILSGYWWGKLRGTLNESKMLTRIIFLETVAGVPGMIAAMVRHLRSLRTLRRDHGWIHTLLEEAENERMHLMTALTLKKPSNLFRLSVIGAQGVFVSMFWVAYFLSPRFCHRFVGYLEEEAVKTYSHCLQCIDKGELPMWSNLPAPPIAVKYWQLADDAVMRDVILAIRADEAHHRLVNHTLSSLQPGKDKNPFGPGR